MRWILFSDWNKDFKPGPFPQTEEERRAAAKKYGLLPEDYKTYREDGKYSIANVLFQMNILLKSVWFFLFFFFLDTYGDYPRLEEKPFEQKDINYPYDHPEFRRNFQEPVLLSKNHAPNKCLTL